MVNLKPRTGAGPHRWNVFLRYPRAALLLSVLAFLPFIAKLPDFRVRSEAQVLLEGDQRNLAGYERVRGILAGAEVLVLSVELEEVFSRSGLEIVRQMSEVFLRQSGVADVKSLTHALKPVRSGFGFEMVPLLPEGPISDRQLAEFRSFCLTHPLIRNLMVSADARHTILMVTYDQELIAQAGVKDWRHEITTILAPFKPDLIGFKVISLPLVEQEIGAILRHDIRVMIPAAGLLLLLVLAFTFRSWQVVLLVLTNQLLLLCLLPGAIDWTGSALTVFSAMLLPLLTAMHLTLLTHIYTSMQRHRAAGLADDATVQAMLDDVFKPCVFAVLTSVVGMVSLAITDVRPIREFGLIGAAGILFVFLFTFGPGLAFLAIAVKHGWLGTRRDEATPARTDRPGEASHWSTTLTEWTLRRRRIIFGAIALIIVLAVIGVSRVRTDIRAVEFLPERSWTRAAMEELDRIYGGVNVVQVELDSGSANGINNYPFLEYVQNLQRFVEERPGISACYSYAQLLSMMNQIWGGGGVDDLKLPANRVLVELFAVALRSADFPFVTTLADPDFRIAYLVLRTRDMPAERYLSLVKEIVTYAENAKPPGVSVSAAKGIHSILEADQRIVRSQLSSVGSSILLIGLVLGILWRSPRFALLSLISNVVPVGAVVALTGFLEIPLNSITVMVAAVTFGMAIEDSVHFITFWREKRKQSLSIDDAIAESLRVKGRAMIATSVALICLFSIFALSSFPPVVHFGLLSAAAFSAALVSVLVLLPALLRLSETPRLPRPLGREGQGEGE